MRLRPAWLSEGGDVPDDVHVPFLRAALAFGLLGGFSLAVVLPLLAAMGRMSLTWITHAQIHGHTQVVGFAGLFVVGVAYKLAPRFGSGRLAHPELVGFTWWLLVLGLLLRIAGQPVAGQGWGGAMLSIGALLEVMGGAAFATIVIVTLRPALAALAPHALLLGGAAIWFVVQAVLGLAALEDLRREGSEVVSATDNRLLLHAQIYGFLLCAFIGVGFRAFPTFFGMPQPSQRLGLTAAVLVHGGLVVALVVGMAGGPERLETLGYAATGAGVLAAISAFGWWRREMRLAAASQPLGWSLRGALLWLTVTGVLLTANGVRGLVDGDLPPTATMDGIRHVLAIGVITLGITAMAQLILPEFASERLVRKTTHWRGTGFAIALTAAVLLRVLPAFGLVPSGAHFWLMGLGGTIAFGAVTAFTVLIIGAWRSHTAYQQRIAAMRQRQREVPMAD